MPYATLQEVKAANKKTGFCFFSKKTAKFHKSTVQRNSFLPSNQTFITKDILPSGTTTFKVWEVANTGDIRLVSSPPVLFTLSQAKAFQKLYTPRGHKK